MLQSEHLFSLLVDSVSDYAIFALDPHGCVASWNTGARRIKQYADDEIIGKHFSIFFPDEAVEARRPEWILETVRSTGHFEEEGWRVRKDGTAFWASIVIAAIYEDGDLIGFAKVTRDLTEQNSIQQRHVEQQALVARMKEREDLIVTLTHDMKNPLIGANRLLELMEQRKMASVNIDEFHSLLKNAIHDVLGLTRNLIDVIRLDSNQRVAILPEKVDLNMLTTQVVKAHRAQALIRDTQITVQLPGESLVAYVDPESMKRVLDNLLNNAVKFAPRQGRVDVRLAQEDSKIVIEIEDDGPGVNGQERSSLFRRFSQAAIGSRYSGGSGLGLYASKLLVEGNGGHIDYVGQDKGGAIFRVELPVKVMADSAVA